MGTVFKIILFILFFAVNVSATNYYFSNSGSDSNNCTSEGTACATAAKAETLTPGANDQILWECGSIFRISGRFDTNGGGTAGNPVVWDAYGTCTTPDDYPILTQTELVTGWSPAGTNLWSHPAHTFPVGPNYFFNGLRAAWIESHDAGCPGSMSENYEMCYSSDRNTVYVRTTAGNPDNLSNPGVERMSETAGAVITVRQGNMHFNRIQLARVRNCMRIEANDLSVANIELDDVTCKDTGYSNNLVFSSTPGWITDTLGNWGINFGGNNANGLTGYFRILNSRISNVGRDAIDIGGGSMPDIDVTISNNTFDVGYNHGIMFLGFNSTGSTFANGTWIVSNNTGTRFCSGIGFGEGSSTGGFANLQITGNRLSQFVSASDIENGVITRYQLSGNGPDCGDTQHGIVSFGNGGAVSAVISRNQIVDADNGIQVNGGTLPRHIDIFNNTIIDAALTGIFVRDTSSTVDIYNNAISQNGGDTNEFLIECHSTSTCNYIDVQTNYFDVENTSDHVYRRSGTNYTLAQAESTFTQWKSSNIGNLSGATPSNLFVNRAGGDYTPDTGSPLIDAGRINPPNFSFSGMSLDIGAIETGTEPDPPEPTVDSGIIRSSTPTLFEFCAATGNPPMLPASGCTGITLNGTSAAPSSCVRNSSNNKCMDVTLDQEPGPTDTITMDYSQAAGNITDSVPTELAETSGFPVTNNVGTNLLDAIVCTSSDTFAVGRELSNSFDGDVSTEEGSSGCNCSGQFTVTCDLGANHDFGIVRIYGDALGTWYCQNYTLEHSLNGADWTTFVSTTSCFGNQWWEQDLNSLTARHLRWTITGNTTDERTQWRELEAYGSLSSGGEEPPPPPPVLKQGRTGATEVGVKAN